VDFCQKHRIALSINPVEISLSDPSCDALDLRNADESEKKLLFREMSRWALQHPRHAAFTRVVRDLIDGRPARDVSCHMGKHSFVIQPDGSVEACFYRPELRVGNIYDEDPADLLRKARRQIKLQHAPCLSLQCVCMVNTYHPGFFERVLSKLKG
jgi:MoaA/NifB/PqqE/SkfB family radical SAM enzyme